MRPYYVHHNILSERCIILSHKAFVTKTGATLTKSLVKFQLEQQQKSDAKTDVNFYLASNAGLVAVCETNQPVAYIHLVILVSLAISMPAGSSLGV